MELAALKPLLSSLVLPPLGPLLLMAAGWLLLRRNQRSIIAKSSMYLGFSLAWLLSCQAIAVICNEALLKTYPVATIQTLKANDVQAVVVLGGGIQVQAPEYQETAQLGSVSATRLRYGSILATQAKLPLAFSGGIGWATVSQAEHTEAQAAKNYLQSFNLPAAKWLDANSADTAENAQEMSKILHKHGIQRIALVTHDWHMTRAKLLFDAQGFSVLPAPVNPIANESYALLNWLPSADGLEDCRAVLRESLGIFVLNMRKLLP